MIKVLTSARLLFEQWNANDVLYCHWKSNEHLYEGLTGATDLDILVSNDSKDKARQILISVGFINVVSQYGSRYPDVEDWIICDRETGKLIHIHLHFRMATGHQGMKEYSLPWSDIVLQNRVFDSVYGVYVCPPNYEIVILFTRIGLKASLIKILKARLKRFRLGESDIKEVSFLKSRVNFSEVKSIVDNYYEADSEVFQKIIHQEALCSRDFLSLVKITHRHMKSYSMIEGIRGYVLQCYYALVLPIRRSMRRWLEGFVITKKTLGNKKGITIAFLGQDGAGKTTVTKDVRKWLSWKMDVVNYYLGNGENYWSWHKRLSVFLRRFNVAPIRLLRGLLIVSDLKNLAKHTYHQILKANKMSRCGRIVIFDRYPQVQFYGINDGPKIRTNYLPKVNASIIKKYIESCAETEEKYLKMAARIEPDLVIKLILDPEISIQRKPQESLENVQKKHDIIMSMKFDESNVYLVDANQDFEQEIRSIHNHIWDLILMKQKDHI